MTGGLGKLERVDLREIWETEAQHFTPWLAQSENLTILGDAIGIELEVEAQEKDVGPFRADILCKNTGDGAWVLIENQLERTDHVHLGQLLTYAAGLHAVTIVWVSARFIEEHRAALDWLNEITDERFKFFGLEVELWRIGNSLAAPKFNIVSKPNDWSRAIGNAARSITSVATTDTQAFQLKYWTALREYLQEGGSIVRPQKPFPGNWYTFSIGRTNFYLMATIQTREKRLRTELYIQDENAKAFFFLLQQHRERIEQEFGEPLSWEELPGKKGSRIAIYRDKTDPEDEMDWPNQHAWIAQKLEQIDRVFRRRVKELDPSDWNASTDEDDIAG